MTHAPQDPHPIEPRFATLGLLLAAAFFAAALTPSLLPRAPLLQGVLGGVVGAIGYEIGALALWVWRALELPRPQARAARIGRIAARLAAAGIVLYALSRALDWQNATRRAVGIAPLETADRITVMLVAAGVFLALWALVRGFVLMRRRMRRLVPRRVPPRIAQVAAFAAALWVAWALIDGVLVRRGIEIADASFEAADALIAPDLPRPTDPARSGAPGSLIAWDEMGRLGRSFVATAPSRERIAAFAGPGALKPIRVYVGRRAADDPETRAALAVAELDRVGGFDRAALVVAIPVGTGWMDPGAHDTLDMMLGGDVATVAVQYSYLTSVLSLYVHPDYGVAQARALFDAVYRRWTAMPRDARPRLYVFGLSQGAYNSQKTLPLLDMLADPIDGALWAGSPFFSAYWAHVRDGRKPDSPAWRPVFGNGSLARAMIQEGATGPAAADWGPVRLVFLNYGSDPIVVFDPQGAWRPPAWLAAPRAPDVAPELRWFPVVTTFQLALDMTISLAVPGHGHAYVARDYVDAWAALLDPPGWSPARAAALKAALAAPAP